MWDRTPLAEDAHKQPAHVPASAPAQQTEGLELADTDEFLALETAAEVDGNPGELAVQDPVHAEAGCSRETESNADAPAILTTLSLSCKQVVLETAVATGSEQCRQGNNPTSNSLSGMRKLRVRSRKQLHRQLPGIEWLQAQLQCLCSCLAALSVMCAATPFMMVMRRQ